MKTPTLMQFQEAANIDPDWKDVRSEIQKIYDGPSAVISKVTRFGGTTSFAAIAKERADKLLLVVPTNKIHDTIFSIDSSAISIYGHKYCQVIQEIEDDLLKELPLALPSICPRAGGCDINPNCKMTLPWYETSNVRIINYHKLVVLAFQRTMNDKTEIALLRNMLKDITVCVFDESHEISLESMPSTDFNYSIPSIPIAFENLRKVYYDYCNLCDEFRTDLIPEYIKREQEELKSESFLSSFRENRYVTNLDLQTFALADLKRLAKERVFLNFTDDHVRFLLGMIGVMSCADVTLNLIIGSSGEVWSLKGKPSNFSPTIKNAIWLFLREVCPEAKIFFMSGTQFEKYPGFYEEIAGKHLEQLCVPDIKKTNSKMTIIPDTWMYSSANRGKPVFGPGQFKRIKNQILDILVEHPCELIYIVCFNKTLFVKVRNFMKTYPLPEGSTIDYYRSSNSQGVKNDARIGIAIGVANTPTNTFDYACSTLEESRSLRFQGVHAATWQAWSRIKDPIGKAPSTLYCIGVRAEVIDAVISHGSGRVVTYNGKDGNNRTIPPTIILKEKLPRPKVLMEARTKIALEPRKVSSELYIDCLVPLEDRILYELVDCRVKDQHNYIYNYICDYVGKLPKTPFKLYNPGVTEDWIKNNSILFYTNIITRTDKCGKQSHTPNKDGKYPYPNEKVKIPFDQLLIQHFEGKETIANPPFNTEDICYWCAVDFDDHDGTTPQTKNVNTFVTYLRSLNIPYFVLLSGSNLGYHVWILLEPCKTYTAHKFIRQCLEDTGLNSKGLEKFPVQKKASNAKNGYGNQLKLPNAFNWKANRRSLLVDPITLKPTPYVEITHVLRLHEIPDVPKSKKAVSSKIVRHIPVNDGRKYGEMRACLIKALENPLVGGIGHTMRVIIANEAINVGMDREAVIDLFRSQNDFVYDITASQVDFAMQKKYHKWMCLTIRENCSELVDCENCTQYIKSKMELA